MKSTNLLYILIIFEIIPRFDFVTLSKFAKKKSRKFSSSKAKSHHIPKLDEIKSDYLSWNTAKYIIENNLAKSDLEKNPIRYKLITPDPNRKAYEPEHQSRSNADSYEKNFDKNLLNSFNKTSKTDTNKNASSAFPDNAYYLDPYPYYGNTTNLINHPKPLIKGPPTGLEFKDPYKYPLSRYGNFDIYDKDQAPYYGSIYEYRKISNIPYNKFLRVPIVIKDLDEFYNEKKIKKKLKEKEAIDIIKKDSLYLKDPKPYYDATILDKEIIRNRLQNIKQEKKNDLAFGTQKILLEKLKQTIQIQNYKNADKEENNKVNRVYYTDTSWYKHKKLNVTYTNTTSIEKGRNRTFEFADAVRHNVVDVDVA